MSPAGQPLLGDPHESTISTSVLRGLADAVEQAGVGRGDFLRATGLELAVLDAPEARLPLTEVYRVCELALDLTGDPALGLHWSERLTDRAFVPISHLIAHSSSLREGFEVLAQFSKLLADQVNYEIHEFDETVALSCRPLAVESLRLQRLAAELMVGGFWRLVRSFDVDARPERVSFAYPAPSYASEYTRSFGVEVRFDQPITRIEFDRAVLNTPSRARDDEVREALQAIAERRLMRITQRAPHSLRVRDFLVREGWPDRTDMSSAARALEISVRSLRRHLDAEGKSYNDILNEALGMVAKDLLRGPRTIQEVAYEMGFSETSAFYRAFKRWTGMTPSTYRDARLK